MPQLNLRILVLSLDNGCRAGGSMQKAIIGLAVLLALPCANASVLCTIDRNGAEIYRRNDVSDGPVVGPAVQLRLLVDGVLKGQNRRFAFRCDTLDENLQNPNSCSISQMDLDETVDVGYSRSKVISKTQFSVANGPIEIVFGDQDAKEDVLTVRCGKTNP